MAVDSVEELSKFQWSDPLRPLCDQCIQKDTSMFVNAVSGYDTYFEYLALIWARFLEEFVQYDVCESAIDELRPKSSGVHKWSPQENDLYEQAHFLYIKLTLDYESFIVFARVLMDKLARVAQLLIGRSKIPSHNSFSKQKKYFLNTVNIPYTPKEDYAKLVREQTNWFDNFLKASRDKIMIHSDLYWVGTRQSRSGGIRFVRADILSGSSLREQAERMIYLKRKYVEIYPQLQEVPDNLWEIIELFMNSNIKIEAEDKETYYAVLHRSGSTLPSLHYLVSCVQNFLKDFSKVFKDCV